MNFFSHGDDSSCSCNGKFSEMWAGFAESYGLVVHRICKDWARNVAPFEVEQALGRHPKVRAVAVAYCDTSTGVANDIEAVCRIASRPATYFKLVDGVSPDWGMPSQASMDWSVDFAVRPAIA